jgi:hypothetical protein
MAAIMIINTGGRDVVIDKLTVRGQEVAWTNVNYNITTASISADLEFNGTQNANVLQTIGDDDFVMIPATNDITLQSGKTIVIYVGSPDSISVNDIGLTVAITVFTSQAMYYKETNVQAA